MRAKAAVLMPLRGSSAISRSMRTLASSGCGVIAFGVCVFVMRESMRTDHGPDQMGWPDAYVVLHRLLCTGEVYEPLRNSTEVTADAA